VSGELPGRRGAHAEAVTELDGRRGGQAHERRDRAVRVTRPEQGALQLEIGTLEGGVVPVEAAAGLGRLDEERDEDAAEERLLLGSARARVRAGEDRCGRLPAQLLDRQLRILAREQPPFALLDVRPHQRPVVIEGGAAGRGVLLERERQLDAGVELAREEAERAEAEGAQRSAEVRGARGHAQGYSLRACSPCSAAGAGGWHSGHQYAVRFASPRPRERIAAPHRGHGSPARR
jgi:hypothetical protein